MARKIEMTGQVYGRLLITEEAGKYVTAKCECPEGLELDRKDNNSNYNKENCHWTTHQENCKNRGY